MLQYSYNYKITEFCLKYLKYVLEVSILVFITSIKYVLKYSCAHYEVSSIVPLSIT